MCITSHISSFWGRSAGLPSVLCFVLVALLLAKSEKCEAGAMVADGDTLLYFTEDAQMSSDSLVRLVREQTGVILSYSSRVYTPSTISVRRGEYTLREVLDKLFARFPVDYQWGRGKIIVVARPIRRFKLAGYCRDALTGEPLVAASVYDSLLFLGQATNKYGFFSVTLPEGNIPLRASYIGYNTVQRTINLTSDTLISIALSPNIMIESIDVRSGQAEAERAQTGLVRIPMEEVRKIPMLLGETDIIRALELLPGVQSGEEGFGGMSVRGGGADQNIVLMDDVPLYYTNHLLGLVSVFNHEAVNDASLIKSGFPARYGGRLSSVLDVHMKEGNDQKFSGNVNTGVLASGATFEGPIVRNKASFILSARRSFFDLFSRQFQQNDDEKYTYHFYDIHAKLNYKPSLRDHVYASFFAGYDLISYDYDTKERVVVADNGDKRTFLEGNTISVSWGNVVASLRWNHIFGNSLFTNTTLAYNQYRFNSDGQGESFQSVSGYYSGINDLSARFDANWYTPFVPGAFRAGAQYTYHKISPGVSVTSEIESDDEDETVVAESVNNVYYRSELHAYLEDEVHLGRFSFNAGLHLSMLGRDGQSPYSRLEPRFLVSFDAFKGVTLKAAYSDMTQLMQLFRVASISTPADMWLPVSTKMSIPRAQHFTAEVDLALSQGFFVSVEGYYKRHPSLQTYTRTSLAESLFLSDSDDIYTSGRGRAAGMEVYVRRTEGRLTGLAGYAWAKAENKFDAINEGRWFAADNDRTHNWTVLLNYNIKENVDLGASWTYSTGLPLTLPDSRYSIVGEEGSAFYPTTPERNAYRMPNSHTLNLGVNISNPKGKARRTLSFGIYNVYGRKNPTFVYWQNEDGKNELRQFSLVAFPWPYIKYSISF